MMPEEDTPLDPAPPAELPPPEVPGVWPWFVAYCVFNTITCLITVVAGIYCAMLDIETVRSWAPKYIDVESALYIKIQGGVWAVSSLGFAVAYAVAPFLPKRPWAWVINLSLIAINILAVCLLPLALPLLVFWVRENTQRFFGITPWRPREY